MIKKALFLIFINVNVHAENQLSRCQFGLYDQLPVFQEKQQNNIVPYPATKLEFEAFIKKERFK